MQIAIIWQRFLPYHVARINHLWKTLTQLGHRLSAIEVASQDASYGFPESVFSENNFKHICCFPKISYHQLKANEIHIRLSGLLKELKPDLVFAPATPFPEGMAGFSYRLQSGNRAVMMDDAWDHTDQRGRFIKEVKRLINKNIDAVFIPAPSHLSYYMEMGFPKGRVIFGVYAVDNDYFSKMAEQIRADLRALD